MEHFVDLALAFSASLLLACTPSSLKSFLMTGAQPMMPECWGHRGASAAFPENTIASFERAIKDGSEGIESDVHITSDDVIVMFHDPSLERTTDGKGYIRDQPYYGSLENVRTTKEPKQAIPTFKEACDLLMQEGNKHVKFNIDIKPDNDPERLFTLMKKIVQSYPSYETDLSPRLILGLWHPKFLGAARTHVPALRRVHIGASPSAARNYFWRDCDGFSMYFACLVGADGQAFLEQAKRDGKDVFVWTVNRKDEMIEATRWGVKAVLTDKTDVFQNLRKDMSNDFASVRRDEVGLFFRWATWRYYMLPQFVMQNVWLNGIEKRAKSSFKSFAQRRRDKTSSSNPKSSEADANSSDLEKANAPAPAPASASIPAGAAPVDAEKAAQAARDAAAPAPATAVGPTA